MKLKAMSGLVLGIFGAVGIASADSYRGYHNQSFDYNYLEGGYDYTNTSGDHDGNGGYIAGSLGLDKLTDQNSLRGFYINGGWGENHYSSTIYDNYNVGLGYHTPIARHLDLIAGIDYVKDFSDYDGVGGYLGVRYKLTHKLELNASEGYTGYTEDGINHKWTTHVGAVYPVWRKLSATANIDYNHLNASNSSQDYTAFGVGARWNF